MCVRVRVWLWVGVGGVAVTFGDEGSLGLTALNMPRLLHKNTGATTREYCYKNAAWEGEAAAHGVGVKAVDFGVE